MGDLSIQRGPLDLSLLGKTSEAPRRAAAGPVREAPGTRGSVISGRLQSLIDSLGASGSGQGRRLLRAGEGVLAEAQTSLGKMAALARRAAGEGSVDRTALQGELDSLVNELDRVLKSAPGLFSGEGGRTLPRWLADGLSGDLSDARLLAELGLDKTATPAQVLAAVAQRLGSSTAADRLAALYLGAIIAGGGSLPGQMDLTALLEGLEQLLGQADLGVPLDESLLALTGGAFSGMADLEAQLGAGTAPGMREFLSALPPAQDGAAGPEKSVSLTGSQGPENAAGAGKAVQTQTFGGLQAEGKDLSGLSWDKASGTLTVGGSADVTLTGTGKAVSLVLAGSGTVTLRDVETPALEVRGGSAQLLTQGENALGEVRLERGASLVLGGDGRLELQSVRGDRTNTVVLSGGAVSVDAGRGALGEDVRVVMTAAASLTAQAPAVVTPAGAQMEPVDVVLKTLFPGLRGSASLAVDGKEVSAALRDGKDGVAARLWLERGVEDRPIHTVELRGRDETGKTRTRRLWVRWEEEIKRFREIEMYPNPFTVTGGEEGEDWVYDQTEQTLSIRTSQVTGFSGGSGVDANGKAFSGRVALENQIGEILLTLNGVECRPGSGRAFSLGRDNDVTLMLERGTQNVFASGRGCAGISLGDGASLTIDTVPIPADPDLALLESEEEDPDPLDGLLDRSVDDLLEHGLDFLLDEPLEEPPEEEPTGEEEDLGEERKPDPGPGSLSASGGSGGAGIGRDSGGSWDRVSRITIRGGTVTAEGRGGGAGIGAGKHGFMGPISITGGTVSATAGQGGGAGIGGALGAPAGDITIRGGIISAEASCQAAAIGAGLEGECGDILIAGTAKIIKAQGGGGEAGIGACKFGGCGEIRVEEGAELSGAALRPWDGPLSQPWEREGVSVRAGGGTISLPRFVLNPRVLRIQGLDLSGRRSAQAAGAVISDAQARLALVQETYNELYGKAYGGDPIRSAETAADELADLSERPGQAARAHAGGNTGDVARLLR